ncbi:hypothetical protein B0H14DRAFT_3532319 [Mycena olivaceomarginata]|nr:hypothetical protein B0H14DRAFT_3532319 [Mycena olivaceomarginata]
MPLSVKQYLSFLLGCATAALAGHHGDSHIDRDVVIIGGGSAGTYTAFRLHQEGLSVALLRLRRHCYHNISVATNYFSALGVDIIIPPLGATIITSYADLNGDAKATTTPIQYSVLLLDNGFNLPDPVPEDIRLSWADFMAKYGLDAAAFSYFSSLSAGGFLRVGPPLITTADFNNQGIYNKALKKLGEGDGAFLNTTISNITRDVGGGLW